MPVPSRQLSAADVPEIHIAYEREYMKFFDRPVPGSDVEVMSFAVVLTTSVQPPATARPITNFTDARPARALIVRDTATGESSPWAVFDRVDLPPGAKLSGPAIICENETSTLVGPGWNASVNRFGYLEMMRETT